MYQFSSAVSSRILMFRSTSDTSLCHFIRKTRWTLIKRILLHRSINTNKYVYVLLQIDQNQDAPNDHATVQIGMHH